MMELFGVSDIPHFPLPLTTVKLLQRISNNIRGNIASLHIQNDLKPKQYSERINYLFGNIKKIFIDLYLKNSYIMQILQLQKQPPEVRPVTLLERDSNTGVFFLNLQNF